MGPTPTEMDLAPAKVRIVLGKQKRPRCNVTLDDWDENHPQI